MKKLVMIGLILFVLPTVIAGTGWMFNASEVGFTVDVHQRVLIHRFSEFSRVAYIEVNTTLFPKSTSRQRVNYQYTKPNVSMEGDWYTFRWRLPQNILNLSVYSTLKNVNLVKQVKKRVEFPTSKLPPKGSEFIQPTKIITSDDPKIAKLASKLAEGENDLYEVLFKLGSWVHSNINYSLSDETRLESRNASWVLSHKMGACDELSALFMALCRALKIPVRYVVGEAYSNLEQGGWQNHGWVEAYFPVYGWIPYDVTYGEFGWIDTSHIVFYYSSDIGTPPTMLKYDGSEVNISIDEPKVDINLLSANGAFPQLYQIKVEPYKEAVGLDSHNLIIVTLNNTQDYYLSAYITLLRTRGIINLDDRTRYVLLKPRESKREFFLIKTSANLSDRYIYTYPIRVVTLRNYTAETKFQAKKDFETFSYERIKAIEEYLKREELAANKTLVKDIDLECGFLGNYTYVNVELPFNCSVTNRGNTLLKNLKLCLEGDCRVFNLNLQETRVFQFKVNYSEPGPRDVVFTVEGNQVSRTEILSIKLLPPPKLEIAKINYPSSVGYKSRFGLAFLINKTVDSPVKDVTVNLSHEYLSDKFLLSGFKKAKLVNISIRGRDLMMGANNFTIILEYKDLLDRSYKTHAEIVIRLENLSIVQKISLWFKGFFRWLDHLFD
ncbi:hypothetical protein DRJ48_03325 [Candidatus Woesearchaeota archaeon]|nr:transglutaminase-like domain-containing protein [Candidatus Woesearchaeota archaeon]RLE42553.1 MAG: hypothetical protein DRJ48_03325 [Candidatus Woesearchaeota archaeon]